MVGLGLAPLCIGLVHRGPVPLAPARTPVGDLAAGLLRWARRRGIVFLRFTHTDDACSTRSKPRGRPSASLARLWPMFEAHARRRGFRHFRSLRWWMDVMRHAEPHGSCVFTSLRSLGRRSPPRDLLRLGIREYTLGPSSGSLYEHKRKFNPMRVVYPAPVTLVVRPALYRLWKATALPFAPRGRA